MPTLVDVVRHQTALTGDHVAHLTRLVADWQIVADLSFADLVLWLPDAEGKGFWAGAQMRPTTGPTAYVDDLVGGFVPHGRRAMLDEAWRTGRIVREGDPEWRDHVPVRLEAIPVRHGGEVLGVVARHTNLLGVRTPSRLELAYLETAGELTKMIGEGTFPAPGDEPERPDSPRVGDGFLRVEADGTVSYASPNAVSAYRRLGRLGDLVGVDLAAMTTEMIRLPTGARDAAVSTVLRGRVPEYVELDSGETVLLARSIPLSSGGRRSGGLVLVRDVTELRRRDRELMTKEATIREIHHRVKNNLQTVAALLRLQARRIRNDDGRLALEEAVRRVGSIAVVHETLSQSFDEWVTFDEVADQLQANISDVASPRPFRTRRSGSFGLLSAEIATPLAMVVTELMQNAAEHAFRDAEGEIELAAERVRRGGHEVLVVDVADDGRGLPDDFDPTSLDSLGISIVSTLVESELGGTLSFRSRSGEGTRVRVEIEVATPAPASRPRH